MTIDYKPSGVCARAFKIEVEDGKITDVNIEGGCPGNLLGIKYLLQGMTVDEAIEKMEGIPCGVKQTSCPDQIAKALKSMASQG